MFITEDFMNEIFNQTNLYAQQSNVSLNVTKNELWMVFGAFSLFGYAKYPIKNFTGQEKRTVFLFYQKLSDAKGLKA